MVPAKKKKMDINIIISLLAMPKIVVQTLNFNFTS